MFQIFLQLGAEFPEVLPGNRIVARLQVFAEVEHFSFFFSEILKYGNHRKRGWQTN